MRIWPADKIVVSLEKEGRQVGMGSQEREEPQLRVEFSC